MGTTYYVNQTRSFLGTYCCSKCRSMILLQFQLKSGGASTWSQAKATDTMNEAVEKLVQALQNFEEKPFLVTMTYDGRSFTTGYEMGLVNADKACPFCGHKEKWQNGTYYAGACKKDKETEVLLVPDDAPADSRMRVFTSLDAAKSHIAMILLQMKEHYQQHWLANPGDAEVVKSQMEGLKSQIAQYEGMLTYVKSASDHIHGQIEAKEAEMKGYSLFAPERKTVKAEIKELTKQYEAQKAADLEQETLIKNYIKEVEKQLKTMKTDYPGVYGELETIEAKGMDVHLAFRVL